MDPTSERPGADALPSLSDRFWRDGFAVAPSVFSPNEVHSMRRRVDDMLRESKSAFYCLDSGCLGLRADLLSHAPLREVLLDPRILAVARSLLGEEPVYFGDSTLQVGVGERGWHRDNRIPDRWDGTGADWSGKYPLIRFGVYLEDHAEQSGGLSVRIGSHTWGERNPVPPPTGSTPWARVRRRWHSWKSTRDGRGVLVDTRVGDVALWTLRTTHSGNSVRFRLARRWKLPPLVEGWLPSPLRVEAGSTRMAMFFTYAARSPHLDRYIEYLTTRGYARDVWAASAHDVETIARCRSSGVAYAVPDVPRLSLGSSTGQTMTEVMR